MELFISPNSGDRCGRDASDYDPEDAAVYYGRYGKERENFQMSFSFMDLEILY